MQDPEAKVKFSKREKKEEKTEDYLYDDRNRKKSSSKGKRDKENEEIKYEKKSKAPR